MSDEMSHESAVPARGSGEALEPAVQAKMEGAFGRSFSSVRVHQDGRAASMGAQAFAQGNDLHFAPGRYDPHSRSGQELIGHELAHVVQQSRGRVAATAQFKGIAANTDEALEREADEVGARVARGEPAGMGEGVGEIAAPVVQGKNLAQVGLADDLGRDGRRNLVGGKMRRVNVYVANVDAVCDNRGDALGKIASANGKLGRAVDDYARDEWGITNPNEKWTRDNEDLNDERLRAMDPFFLKVSVKYRGKGDEEERMELTHQHAKEWTGYIESLTDTGNRHTDERPSMYDQFSERPREITSRERNPLFSNVHDTSDDSLLLTQTEGKREKNFDAYTKIAGEGARFRCVRKHRHSLHNDSYFYTRVLKKTIEKRRRDPSRSRSRSRSRSPIRPSYEIRAIKFSTLWGQWAKVFDKKYNISNETIRRALVSGRLPYLLKEDNNIDNRDYHLGDD